MDAKEREAFQLTFLLLTEHRDLLGNFLPVVREIVTTLQNGNPSPEQLSAWLKRYDKMTQRLDELSVAFESARRVVDQSARFDA